MVAAAKSSYWLGFDLGGTKMHAVLFDARMKPIARRRKKTRGHDGAEAGLERVCSTVEKVLEEGKVTREDLAGIGVGVPGPVDMEKGFIYEAPNLGWNNVPLQELLEQRFGCPVAVCNDVDAGVFGEYKLGAGRGCRSLLGVFPGTGIGGGLVYDGRIFRGKSSSCLELGHIPVIADGAPCGCGRRGCLETVASRLAMSAEIAKAAYRGQAPHILRVAGTDLANIRSGALAEAIAAGDEIVEQIVRTGARHLGMAMAGVVNLMLPDCIVLGGGLIESLSKLYLDEVAAELKHRVMPAFVNSFTLTTAELGDDAGVMGAAAWARQNLSSASSRAAELAVAD